MKNQKVIVEKIRKDNDVVYDDQCWAVLLLINSNQRNKYGDITLKPSQRRKVLAHDCGTCACHKIGAKIDGVWYKLDEHQNCLKLIVA